MLRKKNILIMIAYFVMIPILCAVLYLKKADHAETIPAVDTPKVTPKAMFENKSYFNGEQLLHLRYSNVINDTYKVDVYWFPDFSKPLEPTGSAIINFKDIKNEEDSFNISTNFFSLPRVFFLENKIADENGEINQKTIAENLILYVDYPTLEKGFMLNNKMDNVPPFFFEDVDFDGAEELVIVDFAAAQRHGMAYRVYKNFKGGLQPLYDVTNQKPYASFDSTTQFDCNKKTVTIHFSGGANDSHNETYQYNPESKSYENNKFVRFINNPS